MRRLVWAAALAWGCGGGGAVECEAQAPGLERDRCFAARLQSLPVTDLPRCVQTAEQIADPLVRGEAVITWANAHNRELQPPAGQELCALLGQLDQATCQRRLMTPHLQR
ncbi:MAG: hypothetical protein JNM72_02210 [Deltaproteobacteria bacterium]|nr:hypothetical protein [Deltaproteobacteria bacterium]